jgi:sugar lactone lactonase YvrE
MTRLGVWHVLGGARSMPGLYQPTGIAVSSTGDMYVADTGNNRIIRLSPTGRMLARWPVALLRNPESYPFGPVPVRLAVDRKDDVLVADTNHGQILEYSSVGKLLARWATGFSEPSGVAVGGAGNVFVADSGDHRIVKLSPAGKILAIWRARQDSGPFSVAVDRQGNVYAPFAVDAGPNCDPESGKCGPDLVAYVTDKYTPSGRDLGPLDRSCCGTDLDEQNASLAVDGGGNLYAVTPACGGSVEKRSVDGHWSLWGGDGVAPGEFDDPTSVSVDRFGDVYVADAWNDRIQKLSPNGKPLAQWGTAGAAPGWFATPEGLTVDRQGNVYVNDGRDNRVQELSPGGKALKGWIKPRSGSTTTLRGSPFVCGGARLLDQGQEGVAVSTHGNVFAADTDGDAVAALSSTGPLLATWDTPRLPYGIALAPTGIVYVANDGGSDIERLSSTLQPVGQWSIPASGLTVDRAGYLYAADTFNDRIRKISPDGAVLAVWGGKGTAAGEFNLPRGVSVDTRGNIYVADTGNDRIQELSPLGRPLARWGSMGSGVGQFHVPTAVAVDARGSIYVADSGNNRVQRLYP